MRRPRTKGDIEHVFFDFERWGFDEKRWRPTTRAVYVRNARTAHGWLLANLGITIFAAETEALRAYLRTINGSSWYRNVVRQSLVALGEFLLEYELWKENFARPLRRDRQPDWLPKALSRKQGRAILMAARNYGALGEAFIGLLLYGGLRVTEARTLQWHQVDLASGWLRFKGKGSKDRVVPVHGHLRSQLYRWKAMSPDPRWLFPSPQSLDKPRSDSSLRSMVRAIGDTAGIDGLHPHMLRHTAATALVEQGTDLRTTQEFLGHRDISTTSIYVKVRPARLANAVNRLDY